MKDRAAYSINARDGVRAMLTNIGVDLSEEGLLHTPDRVVEAMLEMTAGYMQDPAKILSTVFTQAYDEMVVLNNIRFFSLCEHHLLPFEGTAAIGYVPNGKVVGISKLARLVECFAKRLQIQERLTQEIAQAIETHLEAKGVAVVIRARHLCMACRGVKQTDTDMVTSALLGVMQKPEARAEFLALAKSQ